MLQWIRKLLSNELLKTVCELEKIYKEFSNLVSVVDDLKAAVAAVSAQLTKLEADVSAKLASDAAALAEAQAAAVTPDMVSSVQALGTQVAAVEATVSPPA